MIGQHTKGNQNNSKKMSHDMWLRVKDHSEKLRKLLVREAKKDLYERLVAE